MIIPKQVVRMPVFQDSSKVAITSTNKNHFRLNLNYQAWYTIVISGGEYLKLMVEANIFFPFILLIKNRILLIRTIWKKKIT